MVNTLINQWIYTHLDRVVMRHIQTLSWFILTLSSLITIMTALMRSFAGWQLFQSNLHSKAYSICKTVMMMRPDYLYRFILSWYLSRWREGLGLHVWQLYAETVMTLHAIRTPESSAANACPARRMRTSELTNNRAYLPPIRWVWSWALGSVVITYSRHTPTKNWCTEK